MRALIIDIYGHPIQAIKEDLNASVKRINFM